MFIRSIEETAEAYASAKRLHYFLRYDDHIVNEKVRISDEDNVVITVKNLSASWTTNENALKSKKDESATKAILLPKVNILSQPCTLNQINLSVKMGSLIGIVGPTGSGNTADKYTSEAVCFSV